MRPAFRAFALALATCIPLAAYAQAPRFPAKPVTQLRLARQRLGAARGHGALQAADRHRDRPRALQGRWADDAGLVGGAVQYWSKVIRDAGIKAD